jgi:hypothetical protein
MIPKSKLNWQQFHRRLARTVTEVAQRLGVAGRERHNWIARYLEKASHPRLQPRLALVDLIPGRAPTSTPCVGVRIPPGTPIDLLPTSSWGIASRHSDKTSLGSVYRRREGT